VSGRTIFVTKLTFYWRLFGVIIRTYHFRRKVDVLLTSFWGHFRTYHFRGKVDLLLTSIWGHYQDVPFSSRSGRFADVFLESLSRRTIFVAKWTFYWRLFGVTIRTHHSSHKIDVSLTSILGHYLRCIPGNANEVFSLCRTCKFVRKCDQEGKLRLCFPVALQAPFSPTWQLSPDNDNSPYISASTSKR
jgi:hypothetical protein